MTTPDDLIRNSCFLPDIALNKDQAKRLYEWTGREREINRREMAEEIITMLEEKIMEATLLNVSVEECWVMRHAKWAIRDKFLPTQVLYEKSH